MNENISSIRLNRFFLFNNNSVKFCALCIQKMYTINTKPCGNFLKFITH